MRKFHLLALAATLLTLTACGGGSSSHKNSGPPVSVTDLAAGAHVVSMGSVDDLSIGKYYANGTGGRFLVIADDEDRAKALYRREDSHSKWIAVPKPTAAVTVNFLRSTPLVVDQLDVAYVVGNYQTRLKDGTSATFAITANGDISAGSSGCKLSGRVESGTLPATLKLTLNAAGCGLLPVKTSGVLIVDRDYAPAVFRLVGDDGNAIVDLWAYSN